MKYVQTIAKFWYDRSASKLAVKKEDCLAKAWQNYVLAKSSKLKFDDKRLKPSQPRNDKRAMYLTNTRGGCNDQQKIWR